MIDADRLARAPVGVGADDAEDQRRDRHQREDQEDQQRELPVEQQQDHDRPDQRQRRLDERDDGVGHERVQRLDVVRHAADQDAGRAALVEADRHRLQVGEDALAQVGERPLPDPAGQVGLRVGRAPDDQDAEDVERDDDVQRRDVAGDDPLVDRGGGQGAGASDAATPIGDARRARRSCAVR